MTKNLFNLYSLESLTEEEENLNEGLVIPHSKSTYVGNQEVVFHLL